MNEQPCKERLEGDLARDTNKEVVTVPVPRKFHKKVNTGRWEWISKTGDGGKEYVVGIKRISNGDILWI